MPPWLFVRCGSARRPLEEEDEHDDRTTTSRTTHPIADVMAVMGPGPRRSTTTGCSRTA
jgi:hypothetical protein